MKNEIFVVFYACPLNRKIRRNLHFGSEKRVRCPLFGESIIRVWPAFYQGK